MMQDYKNYRARRPIDWNLAASILAFVIIVIALAVEWPKEGRELAAMHPVTDCAEVPMIELDMPIERVRT